MKKIIVVLAAMLTFASTAFAQLGSLSTDLVYTPVTPCRILDTRNAGVKSGILVAGTTRGFWGWNNGFTAQGGSATSCGTLQNINEAAILVNFTVVTPDTGGYITAFPADVLDANKPLAATVNFTAGSVVGNNATIKLNQTGTGDDFKIYSTSNVHVVADIVGFYSKPTATALTCTTITSANVTLAANTTGFATGAACATGTTLTGISCRSANWGTYTVNADMSNPSSPYCAMQNTTGASNTIAIDTRCCQVPGR
jgi:hypothetical protein